MAKFARETDVSADRSRAEIEQILRKYGAEDFAYGHSAQRAMIGFTAQARVVRFELPLPKRGDYTTDKQHAQGIRTAWRCLALCIRAKLESVESGIETFEHAFMANIVMPDGRTVGAHAMPLIQQAYESKNTPRLLPHFD
jgi:hypothetical protein